MEEESFSAHIAQTLPYRTGRYTKIVSKDIRKRRHRRFQSHEGVRTKEFFIKQRRGAAAGVRSIGNPPIFGLTTQLRVGDGSHNLLSLLLVHKYAENNVEVDLINKISWFELGGNLRSNTA